MSLSERTGMKHFFLLASGAASARTWIVLVTTLEESCWKNWREKMTGECYGWVLLVVVRAEVKYQGVL